jgi:hypothetical protein
VKVTSEISFSDSCSNPSTFASTAQTDPASDKYTGDEITFLLTEFTIIPSTCSISYSCKSVARADGETSDIDCADLVETGAPFTLTYSADSTTYTQIAPGAYVVTVEGEVDGSNPAILLESTFTLTLVDPCDPPTSVTAATLENQEYTITDTDARYTHPDFTVDPAYCPLTYSYNSGEISNVSGQSAVFDIGQQTLSFEYD